MEGLLREVTGNKQNQPRGGHRGKVAQAFESQILLWMLNMKLQDLVPILLGFGGVLCCCSISLFRVECVPCPLFYVGNVIFFLFFCGTRD
jgi:hypothetical protein